MTLLVTPTLLFAATASDYQYDTFWCKYFNVLIKPFGGCEITPNVSTSLPETPSVFPIPMIVETRPVVVDAKPVNENSVYNNYPTTIIRETVPEFLILQLIKAELKKTSLLTSNNNLNSNVDSASSDELKALALLLDKQSESDADQVGDISRDIRNEIDAIISGDTSLDLLTVTGTTTLEGTIAINGGAITLANFVPGVTTDTLYNSAGSLYWNGNLIAGGTVGTWDSSGGDVYRLTGNVGIGTSTPAGMLGVAGSGYFTGNLTVDTPSISTVVTKGSGNFPGRFRLEDVANGRSFQWLYDNRGIVYGEGLTLYSDSSVPLIKFPHSGASVKSILIGDAFNGTSYASSVSVGINSASPALNVFQAGSGMLFSVTNDNSFHGKNLIVTNVGNVGIGSTTPSAKLSVTGTAGTGDIFAIASSTNARLLTVTSAGNVGIGTTTPSQKLTVTGSGTLLNVSSAISGSGLLKLENTGIAEDNNYVFSFGGTSNKQLLISGGGSVYDAVRFEDNLFVGMGSNNSNVGIGTTTPSAKLSVTGSGIGTGLLTQFADSANTPRMTILDNGNVGIGTISPTALLHTSRTNSIADMSIDSVKLDYIDSGTVYNGTTNKSAQKVNATYTGNYYNWTNSGGDVLNERGVDVSATFSGIVETAYQGGIHNLDGIYINTVHNGSVDATDSSSAYGLRSVVSGNISGDGLGYHTGIYTNVTGAAYRNYGLYIENVTGGTGGNYGIYSAASANSYFAGNVGIGTSSPAAKLSVTGSGIGTGLSFAVADSGNTPHLTVADNGQLDVLPSTLGSAGGSFRFTAAGGVPRLTFLWNGSDRGNIYGAANSGTDIAIAAGSSGAVLLTAGSVTAGMYSNGRFGVGTSTPSAKLSVTGSGTSTGLLAQFADSANTPRMTILDNGNVGIGTTNPNSYFADSDNLVIGNLSGNNGITISSGITGVGNLFFADGTSTVAQQAAGYIQYNHLTNSFGFATNGANERLSITSAGNVGIGTTTPGGKLHIFNGESLGTEYPSALVLEDDSETVLQFLSRNNAYNWLMFGDQDDPDIGGIIYSHPNNQISFRTNNASDRMVIASDGNVGIGTTSPSTHLHVTGSGTFDSYILAEGTTVSNYTALALKNGSRHWEVLNHGTDTGRFKIRDVTAGNLDRLVIDNSGNVGISSTTPSAKLSVTGSGTGAGLLAQFADSANTSRMTILDNGRVGIGSSTPVAKLSVTGSGTGTGLLAQFADSANTPRMTILDNGNVGIGSTTPYAKLSVVGQVVGEYFTGTSTTATSTFGAVQVANSYTFNAAYNPGMYLSAANPYLSTQGTTIFNFNGGSTIIGNGVPSLPRGVLVTPLSTAYEGIVIRGNSGQTANLQEWQNNNGTTTAYIGSAGDAYFSGNVGIGTTTPVYQLDVLASGSDIARFRGSNDTGCTLSDGGVIACSSDLNLKKNISDLDVGIEELLAIRPVNFQWKSEDNLATLTKGFIAQEVELVFPDLVRNGSVGHKTLNQIGLIPVIVQAIKDMWKRFEENFALDADQSAEIEALRQRIEQLEAAQGDTTPEAEIENNEVETGGGDVVDEKGADSETENNEEEEVVEEDGEGEEVVSVAEDESESVTPVVNETEEVVPEVPEE